MGGMATYVHCVGHLFSPHLRTVIRRSDCSASFAFHLLCDLRKVTCTEPRVFLSTEYLRVHYVRH